MDFEELLLFTEKLKRCGIKGVLKDAEFIIIMPSGRSELVRLDQITEICSFLDTTGYTGVMFEAMWAQQHKEKH